MKYAAIEEQDHHCFTHTVALGSSPAAALNNALKMGLQFPISVALASKGLVKAVTEKRIDFYGVSDAGVLCTMAELEGLEVSA